MDETRVDLLHLLQDLRDAHPGSLEETILTEIVADSLDSGASDVAIRADATAGSVTVSDNGRGMSRQSLSRYHDLASTSKRKGRTSRICRRGNQAGAMTLAPLTVEPGGAHGFVTAFMARWGEAGAGGPRRG